MKAFSLVPGAGIEPARLAAGGFESPASTNFTTRARGIALRALWNEDHHYTVENKFSEIDGCRQVLWGRALVRDIPES